MTYGHNGVHWNHENAKQTPIKTAIFSHNWLKVAADARLS